MKIYLAVILVLTYFNCFGQNIDSVGFHSHRIEDKFDIIEFVPFSLEITKESKKSLDIFIEGLKKDKEYFEVRIPLLRPFLCEDEYKADKFLGVKRAKVVVDILTEGFDGWGRSDFYLKDGYIDIPSGKCYSTGVSLSFF